MRLILAGITGAIIARMVIDRKRGVSSCGCGANFHVPNERGLPPKEVNENKKRIVKALCRRTSLLFILKTRVTENLQSILNLLIKSIKI